MRRGWSRSIVVRLMQIGLGLLFGLILTEAVLQVAAVFTWSLRGGHHEGQLGDGRRVAFLGDSNTYGFGAGFRNSYPQVLQRRWNAELGQGRVEVLNLGTPGLNSSKLRQQLPGILTSLRPDLLVIMIGVNDLWTAPASLDGQGESWHYRLWNLSRVYRFLYMLSRVPQSRSETIGRRGTPAGPLISVAEDVQLIWTGRLPPGEGPGQWHANLQWNLKSMITDAQLLGVETVLLTYPADFGWYGQANELIRDTGKLTHTPVVDVAASFRQACPEQTCPELLLPDQHPTIRGQSLVADVVWEHLSAGARADPPRDNASASSLTQGASP